MGNKYFWIIFAGAIIYWGYDYVNEEFLHKDTEEVAELVAYDDNHTYEGTYPPVDENTVQLLRGEKDIASGKNFYDAKCLACHGQDGVGNAIGPNLTDKYWLEGGSINDIFKVIKYGIPEKGMVAWERMLTGRSIEQITSYIISLQDTNPPNAKAPQGELYEGGY